VKRAVALIVAVTGLISRASAQTIEPRQNQIVTTSWNGLCGLFITPTARQIGKGNLAIGFNEAKHTEHLNGGQFTDRQIRGVATYGVADWLEIYYSYYNNMFVIDQGPNLSNQKFHSYGFKVRVMREHPHYWFPEVAIGIRDLGNNTRDIGPLKGVNNGRKLYILATKRVFKNDVRGRFMDLNAGLTWDANAVSGLLGFELTIAPNASLIAEWMWDSPFLNFRDLGKPDQQGRFVFNPGIRIYPELVPKMVLDLGFVGDGEFEFSFGISYVATL